MPLFENLFPYTNLHNLNLDWIIEMIEGIDAKLKGMPARKELEV